MTHDNTALVERRRLLAQVHLGGKRLFGDDRETYEDYLHTHTGQRSCAALSVPQLRAVVFELRRAGALDGPARGGRGSERPTPAQWAKLGALARAMGWEGLESPALHRFVQRTAKVEHSRFLTRAQASRVITGLETWLGQKSSGQGLVDSGQQGSEQGLVASEQQNHSLLATSHSPLPTAPPA